MSITLLECCVQRRTHTAAFRERQFVKLGLEEDVAERNVIVSTTGDNTGTRI